MKAKFIMIVIIILSVCISDRLSEMILGFWGDTGISLLDVMDTNEREILVSDNGELIDLSDFQVWESGDYSQEDGVACYNKRRLRYPDYINNEYEKYSIGLSEDLNIIIFEYDRQMNYIGCSVFADGDVFIPHEETGCFTISLHRTYSEKSLSPGQWGKIFSGGVDIFISCEEKRTEKAEGDVFLLDLSYFQLWESGDYNQEDGTVCDNKRRLRYSDYIEKKYDEYEMELSEDFNLIVFEYNGEMDYLGCRILSNGDKYVPLQETEKFTVSVHRTYSEKSLSLGQWKAIFSQGIKIRIVHGDMSVFEIDKDQVLCTTSRQRVSEEDLVDALLNNKGDELAGQLWGNYILNGVYSLTGEDLDNGNLTIYVSSSEGSDDNSGLSARYPKRTLEDYSGVSNINILLKCGDTFELKSSFVAGSNCVYAAYGEGDRPVINCYQEFDLPFEKMDECTNVWVADMSSMDICNDEKSKSNCNIGQLLIDGEVNWKRKVGSTADIFEPMSLSVAADGSWAADWNTSQLYIYSEDNPNEHDIAYASPFHAITMNDVNNVVFKGIEITGAGMHGISMKEVEDVLISGCYIHHIGGSILVSAGVRYGNAVQLWESGSNVTVNYNFADWIFDTCYTNQGTSPLSYESDVIFTKNIGAHSFWGIETWGDGYSDTPFENIEYSYNIIYDMMDVTNPEVPMYSNKSGKVIFADESMTKEDYVSYRCGYTYNQMSSVNVSNSGHGETVKIHDNVFWNTNRFLALMSNVRAEEVFSCLYDNLFYGETDVQEPALFRYTEPDGTKRYLEALTGYVDDSNKASIWPGGQVEDNSTEKYQLIDMMSMVSDMAD